MQKSGSTSAPTKKNLKPLMKKDTPLESKSIKKISSMSDALTFPETEKKQEQKNSMLRNWT